MDVRYQIFISSTYEDLKEERGKVMEAILYRDCFPACMELFPAIDLSVFGYIKKIIDDSDYVILILGGCYGSIDKTTGKSWTELEFDYAVSRGIPVLVFPHDDSIHLPENKIDHVDENRLKLETFKKKASDGRLTKKWKNADDLARLVASSLPEVFDITPQRGWVRNNTLKYKEALERVKKLEERVNQERVQMKDKEGSLADGNTLAFELDQLRFKMIFVKAGSFVMGATSEQGETDSQDNEMPAHLVTLTNDYWLGETPVTQALWEKVMGRNPSYFAGKGDSSSDCPIEQVSWNDCKEFISRLNNNPILKEQFPGEDYEFGFPTEAEWEFAARGGNMSKHYKYAGSNDFDDVAWCNDKTTHRVADIKAPNELGLYDMCGNVWEWCKDWYGEYHVEAQTDPLGPEVSDRRVARGGSWHCKNTLCRVSTRGYGNIDHAGNALGLRLALKKRRF